jgi:hypothetical protein
MALYMSIVLYAPAIAFEAVTGLLKKSPCHKQKNTACLFDIRLHLTSLGQAKQFIETCGT